MSVGKGDVLQPARYFVFKLCENNSPSTVSEDTRSATVCPASKKNLTKYVLDAGTLNRLLAHSASFVTPCLYLNLPQHPA